MPIEVDFMTAGLQQKLAAAGVGQVTAQAFDLGSFGWGTLVGVIIAGVAGALIVIFVLPAVTPAALAAQIGAGLVRGLVT